VFETWSDRHIL